MAGSAALPPWLLQVPKGHEILALLAFFGLCLGMVCLTYQAIERVLSHRVSGNVHRARLYATVVVGAALTPILLAGLAQAYVRYALPQMHWVSLAWRARGIPVYLSFAFWEWVTCIVLSAYIMIMSLAAQDLQVQDTH